MRLRTILVLTSALLSLATFWQFWSAKLNAGEHTDRGLVGLNAPEINSGTGWINSNPLKLKDLRGKVVLVDFWEYTCVNCVRTLPYVKMWYDRYKDQGLVIIGVHTPEFQFGKDIENVRKAVTDFKIKYPVVLDNNHKIWDAFANHWWPRKILIDKNGKIRYDHAGEGNYDQTEKAIQELLAESNSNVRPALEKFVIESTPGKACYPVTPESYLGYSRGVIGNQEGYQPNQIVNYNGVLADFKDGEIYAKGPWLNSAEYLKHARQTNSLEDFIAIRYHAVEVNLVIHNNSGQPYRVYLFQDGSPIAQADQGTDIAQDQSGRTYVEVKDSRMYRIISSKKFGSHVLRLSSDSNDFEAYAFTFGSCEIK